MSDTPPMSNATPRNGERDKTPDVTNRERCHREHDENDRDRHSSRNPRDSAPPSASGHDRDRERERRERHRRHYEDEDEEQRRERKRRYERDEETDEDRERRRRRREERDRDSQRGGSEYGDRERSGRDYRSRTDDRDRERRDRDREHRDHREHREHRHRDRSRESMRSYRSRDRETREPEVEARRMKTNEEREAERARRDREMQDERREAARRREEHFAELDRQREADRRRSYRSPPPQRLRSPPAHLPPPPPPMGEMPEGAPPEDPGAKLLHEVDSEARSVFVSQLAVRLTSADLGLFFEDKLGRGAVRDARVVMDKVSRRSKGIGYVELDDVELVNRAVALSGQVVMGIPIQVTLTESEKNREGVDIASIMAGGRHSQGVARAQNNYVSFPQLSTGLQFPPGYDPTANQYASIPYHRLFVSNIASTLNRDDIYQVFEAFGEIVFVDLQYHMNGASKEQAYVQFKDLRAAQMAVDAMNGFELAGRHIKVVAFQERMQVPDQIDDTRRGPKMDNYTRQQLMRKLAREDDPQRSNQRGAPPPPSRQTEPTNYLLVGNMFNPDEETDRNWDLDLAEDVKGEVEKQYGPVKRIKVDKMSKGDVYIEFEAPRVASLAQRGLDGRFFGGRKLQASFIAESLLRMHMA